MNRNSRDIYQNIISVKNLLPQLRDEFLKLVFPLTLIRRIECLLFPKKNEVINLFSNNPNIPDKVLCCVSGHCFYNTNKFSLIKLLDDPSNITDNLFHYVSGFSLDHKLKKSIQN